MTRHISFLYFECCPILKHWRWLDTFLPFSIQAFEPLCELSNIPWISFNSFILRLKSPQLQIFKNMNLTKPLQPNRQPIEHSDMWLYVDGLDPLFGWIDPNVRPRCAQIGRVEIYQTDISQLCWYYQLRHSRAIWELRQTRAICSNWQKQYHLILSDNHLTGPLSVLNINLIIFIGNDIFHKKTSG